MLSQKPDAVLKRIINIKQTISQRMNEEEDFEEMQMLKEDIISIDTLLNDMSEYTKSVFIDNEKNANLARFREECSTLEEYQNKIEEIEIIRKSKHDKFIVSIKLADKICQLYGQEPIYGMLDDFKDDVSKLMEKENRKNPEVVKKRHEIANWGFDIVISCIAGVTLGKDLDVDYEHNLDSFLEVANILKSSRVNGVVKDTVNIQKNSYR